MRFFRSAASGELPAGPVSYFAPLDVVRFIAAMMVLIAHSYDHWTEVPGIARLLSHADGSPTWWAAKVKGVVGSLNAGVDLFFLLSGFLITYLLLAEREKYGRIDIKSFYMRRVLRIWPLYYICVGLAPVLTYYYQEPAPDLLKHALFLGNFNIMHHGWSSTAVNHLWSICIEEHFYLVWPLMVALVPARRLPEVFSVVILGSFLTRFYYFYFVPYSWMSLYLNTFCRWDTLAIGSLFAYAYYYRLLAPRVPRSIRVMVYLAAALLFVNDTYGNWDTIFLAAAKKYVYLVAIAFALGNMLFNPDAMLKWRRQTIFHYFGKISYGIYMYHGFIILLINKQFPWFHDRFFLGWVMVFTLIVSAVSYELIEKPLLRLKKSFDAFRASRTPAAATAKAAVTS